MRARLVGDLNGRFIEGGKEEGTPVGRQESSG